MNKRKQSQKKNEKTDYNGIIKLIFAITISYLVITNWTMIMVGGLISVILIVVIIATAAYYILPAIGVTALAGLFGATGTLINAVRRK